MKRRDLIGKIATAASQHSLNWGLVRNSANHDVYSLEGLLIPIPRHNEIGERLAVEIFKECQPKLGKGWWR